MTNPNIARFIAPVTLAAVALTGCSSSADHFESESQRTEIPSGIINAGTEIRTSPRVIDGDELRDDNICAVVESPISFGATDVLENTFMYNGHDHFYGFPADAIPDEIASQCTDANGNVWIPVSRDVGGQPRNYIELDR